MSLPQDKIAELQAELDWIGWKLEEHQKAVSGGGEFFYDDPGEMRIGLDRRSELLKILKQKIPDRICHCETSKGFSSII